MGEHKSAVSVFETFDVFFILTIMGICDCLTCPTRCTFCNSTDFCFSCDNGYSGRTCQQLCDKCKPDTKCIKENGFCEESCKDGLGGTNCNIKCDSICESCHRDNTTKCLTYRNNQTSESVCPKDCLSHNCKGNNCTKACLPGYSGKNCEHGCPEHCSTDTSSTDAFIAVVAILTVVLLILLGGILFMLFWKRRQSRSHNDSHLVVYRPQQTMGRQMENHDHSANMSWTYDDAFSDNYDHLAKSSSTTEAKSDTVVPGKNGNYSYAALDAGYKATRMAEDTEQNKREEQ